MPPHRHVPAPVAARCPTLDMENRMTTPATTSVPHGGTLIDRVLTGEARDGARERAAGMPKVTLGSVALSDLELIGNGAFSPLTGFMGEADYRGVVDAMQLANGLPWTIPITLAVTDEQAASLRVGPGDRARTTATAGSSGSWSSPRSIGYDKAARGAAGLPHDRGGAPRRRADLCAGGDVYLGGAVLGDRRPAAPALRRSTAAPRPRRARCSRSGAGDGSSASRPATRSTARTSTSRRCALEIVDGLLLHPLVGETKSDDIPADVRMRCYEALLADYYPRTARCCRVYPAAMRYGGPREAIFHAIARKNYGCTHFIVGRDHAGVGNYYGTYDAQQIFDEFEPGELGITPLFFEHTFYCHACEGDGQLQDLPARRRRARDPLRHEGARDAARRRDAAAGVQPPAGCPDPHRRLPTDRRRPLTAHITGAPHHR